MEPFYTLADVIRHIEKSYSRKDALNYRERKKWVHISTEEFIQTVKWLTLGLVSLGIKRGEKVGILSKPSPQWTMADYAIIFSGAVSVPLFANISHENFRFEIEQTKLKSMFVVGKEQWAMFHHHKDSFETVISLDNHPKEPRALPFQELINKGKLYEKEHPNLFDELLNQIKKDDLATIIYTSGSTGFPKGAMVTHWNLASMIHVDPFPWYSEKDLYLNLLPLAHIFARMLNNILIAWGTPIYYLNDIKQTANVAKVLHPTIAVLVPRILEKIYTRILSKVSSKPFLQQKIASLAFALAHQPRNSFLQTLFRPLADKLVYSKVRETLGGKLRVIITGGAALSPHLANFFINLGFPIYEGWGLTEAAPVCVNIPQLQKIGTVGPPLEGMEVILSDESELLVRGPLVMQGYYKNPEESAKALDDQGWLHTGDKGAIDEDHYVKILGRIKELYKMTSGEYIAPVPIEQMLTESTLIDMAMVIGDNMKFAACLLFPDPDVLKQRKEEGAQEMSDEEYLQSPKIKAEVDAIIADINTHINKWEKLKKWRFVTAPLTIEGGELTPTMKIRRNVVLKKYADLVSSIYG